MGMDVCAWPLGHHLLLVPRHHLISPRGARLYLRYSAMDDGPIEEVSVTFNPQLFLQRRGWVFEMMRREGVTDVCAESRSPHIQTY